MKKEPYTTKQNRVFKELNALFKNDNKISSLTEDQRYILHIIFSAHKEEVFTISNKENFWMDMRQDHHDNTCQIDDIDDFYCTYTDHQAKIITLAKNFIKKHKVVYYKCGWYDLYTFIVDGYTLTPDTKLIAAYIEFKIKEKKAQEKLKKQEAKNKKTISIDGKKYKLVEEGGCACACGCVEDMGCCDCDNCDICE